MTVMSHGEMRDAIEYSLEFLDRYWKSGPHIETSKAYKAYRYVELAAKAYLDISKKAEEIKEKEIQNELPTVD